MNFAARQTGEAYDNGSFTTAQVSYLGQVKDVPQITPYGYFSMPPVGSSWCIFPLRENDNDMVGSGNDYKNRPKDLRSGDVCLFNTISKTKIVLRTTGDLEVYAPKNINVTAVDDINFTSKNFNVIATEKATIKTPELEIEATTTHTGSLTVIGTIIADLIKSIGDLFWNSSKSVSLHTHSGGAVPPPD